VGPALTAATIFLIVGLGNPGPKYVANRHNIGFICVDHIAEAHHFPPFRKKFNGLYSEGIIHGKHVLLLKPETFMNLSGDSVLPLASFYKIPPERILVIHDELDLDPGKIRLKKGGGSAGHNGLKSVSAHLGPDYWRLRMGIGHPGDRALVHSYVLKDFAKADNTWIGTLCLAISEGIKFWLEGDSDRLSTHVALKMSPPKEKTKEPSSTPSPIGDSHGI
jgi:peptidyl-tRNA hydrolase, PTH1 family